MPRPKTHEERTVMINRLIEQVKKRVCHDEGDRRDAHLVSNHCKKVHPDSYAAWRTVP